MKSKYYRVISLCIIFLLSSSVLYTQTRTFTVYLQNERNQAINGANIIITPQSRITSQRFVLQDRGGGVYTTNLPTVLIDSEFSININVEEYMPENKHYFWAGENSISYTLGTLMGVDGKILDAPYNNNVNLSYRNYYERYNVDPTPLIEIFGEFTVRLDQEQKLYPAQIRMNFVSPLPVNMVHENHQYIRPFLIRQYMYEDVIYEIILQTGLERSRFSRSVIDEFINEVERRRNIRYLNDLDQDMVSLVSLLGTYFEDTAKDIFTMLKGAAIAYDLNKAINDGVVLGLLRTIAYHSFQWESYDIFKRKAERSPLYRDRAFREAINNVKNKIEQEQNKQARELVNSLRLQLVSGVVSTEIFKGILSGSLAAGLGISSLKSALITDVVQGGFQRQVFEGAMILLTQIDKYVLNGYYDTYHTEIKYIIENNSEMYYGTLMRLHTGYMFNEMRRKYFGGENQGLIRRFFSDVIDPKIGFGSILREIALVSDEKMKKAENAYYIVSGLYPSMSLPLKDFVENDITPPTTSQKPGTVTDIDGNVYKTVQIGRQLWMAENLKVTRYRNGNVIPNVTGNSEWRNIRSGVWSYFNNDPSHNNGYGKLYNWYAVNDRRGLCPDGWRVPDNDDWDELVNHLGGSSVAGGKLKSRQGWRSPNAGATDESGFSGLPGGGRFYGGSYSNFGRNGYWWSSTEAANIIDAWYWRLDYNTSSVTRDSYFKQVIFSVRCLRY